MKDAKPKSYVLSTRHFPLRHTGKNIADAIKSVLNEYGIPLKKTVFISDNGSNILLAIRLLGVVHFSCFAHDLNLTVATDGLKKNPEIEALIEKGKGVVKYF